MKPALLVCLIAAVAAAPASGPIPSAAEPRITPDYRDGPWHPMDPDYQFHPTTVRPRVDKALEILKQVEENTKAGTRSFLEGRKEKLDEETELLNSAKGKVERLTAQVAQSVSLLEKYKQIPTVLKETDSLVVDVIVPLYNRISSLFEIDAQVRRPFADRLAQFTQDLQSVVRARDDASHKLREYMPPDQLGSTLEKFSNLAAQLQTKVDEEVHAAEDILNPNKRDLEDAKKQLQDAQTKLQGLKEKLKSLTSDTRDFVTGEEELQRTALEDQKHVVAALTTAGQHQDSVLEHITEAEEEQLNAVNHARVILEAMLVPEHVQEQAADAPPLALQRPIKEDSAEYDE